MALVGYSDSEGSEAEDIPKTAPKSAQNPPAQTNFAVDKANPKKIRVKLTETKPSASDDREDGEPAAKRPRVGAGAFSGFNAMLPAPKRDNLTAKPTNGHKAPARKVFSLKTGAEPAFSREADAELKELFTGQDRDEDVGTVQDVSKSIPTIIPKPTFATGSSEPTPATGKPFMFKPLSVARNSKKKKAASQLVKPSLRDAPAPPVNIQTSSNVERTPVTASTAPAKPAEPPQKVSLFSSGPIDLPPDSSLDHDPTLSDNEEEEDEIIEVLEDEPASHNTYQMSTQPQPESLTSIADTLNLSAAERRQLLGRNPENFASNKIINFNTDTEYAANQSLIAAGEQIQHNPVRAIAPGKHSLKQLVASAQGQKDALEESFASGKRNKREAGSKYGW